MSKRDLEVAMAIATGKEKIPKRDDVNKHLVFLVHKHFPKEVVKSINRDICSQKALNRAQASFYSKVTYFEKRIVEPYIKEVVHYMVPEFKSTQEGHANRYDLKISMRKYVRQYLIDYFEVREFFPPKE